MFAALLDLVLPTRCAGCAAAGAALCGRCGAALSSPFQRPPGRLSGQLPPIWVAGRYDGAVRAAILAYKERGRRELSRVLGRALAAAVVATLAGGRPGPAGLVLVPVPSRAAAARARGGDHVRRLAEPAAAALARLGVGAAVWPILRLRRTPRDAAGLRAGERAANIHGAFAVVAPQQPPRGHLVVVDDLVTTGSTVAEAVRALRAAGLVPVGAAALAATIRRHPVNAKWPGGGRVVGVASVGHDTASRVGTSCPGPMTGR